MAPAGKPPALMPPRAGGPADGEPASGDRGGDPPSTGSSSSSGSSGSSAGALVEPLQIAQGDLIADKYRVERRIARGGMGEVWAGLDTVLNRPIAIKFMMASLGASESLRARFMREAQAAAQLGSAHVVQIFDYGVHEGLPFMILELLEGEDLHARLKRQRRMQLGEATRIFVQIAKALRRAHSKGTIHRDLKPQNVFLARQDEEEIVKLLDFGIAKTVGSRGNDTTQTGIVLGSPNFMSPEQARGLKGIDHRTDLWSAAVILFRMLTGKVAFRGDGTGDIIVKICTDPLPMPTKVRPELPPELDAFFERAMARNPDERFQDAMAMAQALATISKAYPDGSGPEIDEALDGGRLSSEWTPLSLIDGAPGASSPSGKGAATPGAAVPPLAEGRKLPGDEAPTKTRDEDAASPSPASRPSSPGAAGHGAGVLGVGDAAGGRAEEPDSVNAGVLLGEPGSPDRERRRRRLVLAAAAAGVLVLAGGGAAVLVLPDTPPANGESAATDAPIAPSAEPVATATTDGAGAGLQSPGTTESPSAAASDGAPTPSASETAPSAKAPPRAPGPRPTRTQSSTKPAPKPATTPSGEWGY